MNTVENNVVRLQDGLLDAPHAEEPVLTVGLVIDAALRVIPHVEPLAVRIPLLLGGTVLIGLGAGLYIGAGLGPGPRDGLMTAFARRGHPLWLVRTVLEFSSLAIDRKSVV